MVGFNLICGLDNAFILGYSFLIMSFLGWAAGSVLFLVGMCICFYCNCVTGTLHTLGGHRNIHFRDLARTGFGKLQVAFAHSVEQVQFWLLWLVAGDLHIGMLCSCWSAIAAAPSTA